MAAESSSSPLTDKLKPDERMPPGMVMGPDGKPCKVCTAFRNWKPGNTRESGTTTTSASSRNQREKQQLVAQPLPGSAGAPSSSSTDRATSISRPQEPPPGCPPDSEQLGRATWTFLHATAAYYPDRPSPTQRANMIMLLRSLPVLYPCGWCAKDFGEDIERNPPDVSSRVGLSRWLCERHNVVNVKLGKEKFDCVKVDERWKDGPTDGRCD